MQWFVTKDTERLELPDGQWIRVKQELSVGEDDGAVLSATVMISGQRMFDSLAYRRARAAAYITAWSLDAEVGRSAIDNMTTAAFEAIHTAIEAFEQKRGQEKNAPTPAQESAST